VPFWMNERGRKASHSRFDRLTAALGHLLQLNLGRSAALNPPPTPLALSPTEKSAPTVPPVPTVPTVPTGPSTPSEQHADFSRQTFDFEGEQYGFNLYVPPMPAQPSGGNTSRSAKSCALPLVVMLHGCKQDAPDFALGTDMNTLAARTPCLVLYPEQLAKANQMRCWNWYDIAHQGRHAGEPAMLAALTRQVMARYPVDPQRVYIAGLSAGGAMAAIVAAHYPELFAAVGVHSGLPPGAAHDVMSAFSAMRHGNRSGTPDEPAAAKDVMPTVVFHGRADRTVHPDNSDQIVLAAVAALQASGLTLKRSEVPQTLPAATGELRQALRTVYKADDGRNYVEHWSVEAGPHAWSGGQAAGSFTDPHGPRASEAMLNFFLQHQRTTSPQKPGKP